MSEGRLGMGVPCVLSGERGERHRRCTKVVMRLSWCMLLRMMCLIMMLMLMLMLMMMMMMMEMVVFLSIERLPHPILLRHRGNQGLEWC